MHGQAGGSLDTSLSDSSHEKRNEEVSTIGCGVSSVTDLDAAMGTESSIESSFSRGIDYVVQVHHDYIQRRC